MVSDEVLREAVLANASGDKLMHAAIAGGMKPLRQDGIEKAIAGVTTFEEVLRVTAAAH